MVMVIRKNYKSLIISLIIYPVLEENILGIDLMVKLRAGLINF